MNTVTNDEIEVYTLKIGSIFHWQWGYDQTNNYFYRVEKINPKSVSLKRIIITNAIDVGEGCGPFATEYMYDFNNLKYKYYSELEENGKQYLTKQFAEFEDSVCIDPVNRKYKTVKSYYLKGFKSGFCKLVRGTQFIYSSRGA